MYRRTKHGTDPLAGFVLHAEGSDPLTVEDKEGGHLRGAPMPVKRTERRRISAMRTLDSLKAHGNGYRSASPALRSAVERHFGSWAKGCDYAGLPTPIRGRPPKRKLPGDVGYISKGEMIVPTTEFPEALPERPRRVVRDRPQA